MSEDGDKPQRLAELLRFPDNVRQLSPEEDARRAGRRMREERLDRVQPAITDADLANIIHDRLTPTHALQVVRGWTTHAFGVDSDARDAIPRFLVLGGERGRGKTVAAVWAMANYGGTYLTAGELLRCRLSKNFQDIETLREAHRAPLLVLDDLGDERIGDAASEMLFELVNDRQNRKFTIITTNLSKDQLRMRYGENADRAVDRIAHQGGFILVRGQNLRRTWTMDF